MPRQADDPDVEGEVLASELGAVAGPVRRVQDPLLHLRIPERPAAVVSLRREVIQVTGGGELHRLQAAFGGRSPDDESEVVGGAGGRPQGFHLLHQELLEIPGG